MNGLDVALVALLLVALLLGLTSGLIRLSLALLSLASGGVAAVALARPAAAWIGHWVRSPELALLLGFTAVFALVLVLFSGAAWLLRRVVARLGLGWADRVLGALTGAAVVVAASALVALALARLEARPRLVQESRLLPGLAALGGAAAARLPPEWRSEGERLVDLGWRQLGRGAAPATGDTAASRRGK